MKVQLVIQFPVSSIEEFDAIVALEDSIIRDIGNLGDLDGHDAGSGEMNIFIHSNDPQSVFEKIESLLRAAAPNHGFKAGYRSLDENEYLVLFPKGATHFSVK